MYHIMLDSSSSAAGAIGGVLGLVIGIFYIYCLWRIFTKAGKPGWAAIIPIYNTIVLLNIGGLSGWFVLLGLVPVVNIILAIIIYWNLGKAFGKGVGFQLGLIILSFIFIPILAFDSSRYVGAQPAMAAARYR
jgi:hypothetical protein